MKKVLVFDLFGRSLSSREQADQLYGRIRTLLPPVAIDFSGVEFVSRSFADQFYKRFLELNKVMFVQVVNGNQVVSDLLSAVTRTQNGNKSERIDYQIQTFQDKNKLREYLVSIE